MGHVRHTRMAPAAIQTGTPPQQQLQRIFVPAESMDAGAQNGNATKTHIYDQVVWEFPEDADASVLFKLPIPLDWMAGTDTYLYPVFCTSVNLFAKVRWLLEYIAMTQGMSYASVAIQISSVIDADGTGMIIPKKSEWMTLVGSALAAPGEPAFKRDDFTLLSHVKCRLHRTPLAPEDTHPGHLYLFGVQLMYQAFI